MAHVRKQLRDAVVTTLTGLTTTGTNVFAGRDLPIDSTILPALCIYTRTDVPDYEAGIMWCTPERGIELVVDGYAKGASDDLLDTIAAEVETAMFLDDTQGGIATGTTLGEQIIDAEDEADQTVGHIQMIFNVFYRVAEGAPETAV